MNTLSTQQPPAGVFVGALVDVQLYAPFTSDGSPANKTAGYYGHSRRMLVRGITLDYNSNEYARSLGRDLPEQHTIRYWCADPDRPNAEHLMSWFESDWADITPAPTDGALF